MNIEEHLKEFVETFMPDGFAWRKGQREAVQEIVNTYLEKKYDTVILDAPVGSGKSIIAICSAWILNNLGKKGYILSSDISLQTQYEQDLKRFMIPWGSVKGIDNYMCSDNGESNSLGTCRIRNKHAKSMYCYGDCPYFSARDAASASSTASLNYAYWLVMMNYVNEHIDDAPFKQRDFTFCDEAHNLLDIVQNHYSPRFDSKTLPKIEKLTRFFAVHKVNDHEEDMLALNKAIKNLYEIEDQEVLHKTLKQIELTFERYRDSWEVLKDTVKKEYSTSNLPKEWREALRLCDWLKDLHCKVEDFNAIISQTSTRNLIKNPGFDEIVFNCLEENHLMHKYFFKHTGFKVLMSATFSDPSEFMKSVSLSSAKYIKVESTFNFDRSPIYFWNKRRMSYNNIEANTPWLIERVNEILEKHPNESGLIHSASYKLAMKVYEGVSAKTRRRLLIYNGTDEKRTFIEEVKRSKNKVIIGPSLLEGLDMKDDFSRFMIFLKVPYMSLGDRFVKVKSTMNPGWYKWRAVLSILQGIGRIVRSENDWGITYMLDGAMADLIFHNRKAFPQEFINRLKIVDG